MDARGSGGRLSSPALPFRDRPSAAALLAEALRGAGIEEDSLVLAIPRGGVPIGAIIAKELGLELDIIVAHKLGAPGNPEFAIGAATSDGTILVEPWARGEPGVNDRYLQAEAAEQVHRARAREERLRRGRPRADLAGRTVVIVDDGIATGATVRAAIQAARAHGAKRVVVAAPVAAAESAQRLREQADEVVVLATPEPFFAVGLWYRHFEAVDDDEIATTLEATAAEPRGSSGSPNPRAPNPREPSPPATGPDEA
jgi:putative phosphoribosyl transferase